MVSEMSFLRSIIMYGNMEIVIYGAGKRCEYLIRWLSMESIQVKLVIDSDVSKHLKEIDNCRIYHVDKISQELKGKTIWFSTVYYESETTDIMYILFKNDMKNIMYPFAKKYGLAPYRHDWAYYYMHHNGELVMYAIPKEREKERN